MFIVMTIPAQQLPVAAVRRVVVMIVIPVMDGQFLQPFSAEIASATATDRWEEFERFGPIGLLPVLAISQGLGNDPVPFTVFWSFFPRCHPYLLSQSIIACTSLNQHSRKIIRAGDFFTAYAYQPVAAFKVAAVVLNVKYNFNFDQVVNFTP